MITVSFPEILTCSLHFVVLGHSSVNKGNDIVCAAVSALTQTFLRGIEKNLNAEFKGEFLSGKCDLSIEVPEESEKEFKIICEVFRDGFREIAKAYPEQVKLNCQEIYHGS